MNDRNAEAGVVSTGTRELQYAAANFFIKRLRVPVQPDWGVTADGHCQCDKAHECAHAGKHPSVRRPREKATTDLHQVANWVRAGRNLAGVPHGYVVVDVDRRPGQDGMASFTRWCELAELDVAEMLSTLTVRTGGGGLHLWYWLARGCMTPRGMDGFVPDVDVKTSHKISDKVTLPGSRHASGRRYEFVFNGPGELHLNMPLRAPDVLVQEIAAGRAWRPLPPDRWPAYSPPGGPVMFRDFIEASMPHRRAEILPPGSPRPNASVFTGMSLGSLTDDQRAWTRWVS